MYERGSAKDQHGGLLAHSDELGDGWVLLVDPTALQEDEALVRVHDPVPKSFVTAEDGADGKVFECGKARLGSLEVLQASRDAQSLGEALLDRFLRRNEHTKEGVLVGILHDGLIAGSVVLVAVLDAERADATEQLVLALDLGVGREAVDVADEGREIFGDDIAVEEAGGLKVEGLKLAARQYVCGVTYQRSPHE